MDGLVQCSQMYRVGKRQPCWVYATRHGDGTKKCPRCCRKLAIVDMFCINSARYALLWGHYALLITCNAQTELNGVHCDGTD